MYTKRLQKLFLALPKCRLLADVGCDHGYVGIYALQKGIAERVCFSDISLPSLQKARQNCPEQYLDRAQFVCQDGLQDICADCAVIAGMGGMEIISVLKNARHLPEKLVLQPMRSQRDVREFLSEKYKILSDEKFFDGKFYDLITAQLGGGTTLSEEEKQFGKTNLLQPSEDFLAFLQKEKATCEQILNQCNDAEAVRRYEEVCRIIRKLTEETS